MRVVSEKNFDRDLIITDPCYIIPARRRDAWKRCGYGKNMESLGLRSFHGLRTPLAVWKKLVKKLSEEKGIYENQDRIQ